MAIKSHVLFEKCPNQKTLKLKRSGIDIINAFSKYVPYPVCANDKLTPNCIDGILTHPKINSKPMKNGIIQLMCCPTI